MDRGLYLAGLLVAFVRLVLHRPGHDLVQPGVGGAALAGRGPGTAREVAGEHFVKHDAQAVNVRPVVHGAAAQLLRRGVFRRAKGGSREGAAGGVRMAGFSAEEFGQAEVGDAHPAGGVHEDIAGLDVAVHKPLTVGILQRVADLPDDLQGLGHGQITAPDQPAEIRSGDMFHDNKQMPGFRPPEVMQAHDIRMTQPRQSPGLALKPRRHLLPLRQHGGQEFNGDIPPQPRMHRVIHRAHGSASDQAVHLIFREPAVHHSGGRRLPVVRRQSHGAAAEGGGQQFFRIQPAQRRIGGRGGVGGIHDGKRGTGKQLEAPHTLHSGIRRPR